MLELNHVTPSVVQPLTPTGLWWEEWPVPIGELRKSAAAIRRFYNASHEVSVISAVEVIAGEGAAARPEYHISITRLVYGGKPRRASNSLARFALRQFGFEGCEEDNHVPGGVARNYFRPVASDLVGQPCACKATEPEVREDKGDYVWRHAPK